MDNNNQTDKKRNIGQKVYLVFILLIYFGMGGYFIAINSSDTLKNNSYLPSWSYSVLGVVLIVYGILRFRRAIRKQ
ncbi:MAG: hypothetical protein RR202_08290 [Bacteroidales bacterium]